MIKSDPRARLKPCLRCGYSLRNITDSRNCPECGLAIWLSLSGNDDLEMSSPTWLRRLAWGTLVLAAANAGLGVGLAAGLVVRSLAGRLMPMSYASLTATGLALYLAASGAGLLLLAGDERRYPERTRTLRRIVVAAAVGSLALSAWLITWRAGQFLRPPNFLILTVLFAQAAAGWAYLADVARRGAGRRVVRLLRGLLLAMGVAFAATIFRGSFWLYLMMIMPWSRHTIAWTAFFLIYPPVAAGTLLYLALALRRAAVASEKNWAKESA